MSKQLNDSVNVLRAPGVLAVTLNVDAAEDLPIEAMDGDGDFRYGDSPEDIAHDNLRRAGFAAIGVHAFAKRTGLLGGEDMHTTLSDLLCDLHHLADAIDLDWDELLNRADGHYEPEIRGEL